MRRSHSVLKYSFFIGLLAIGAICFIFMARSWNFFFEPSTHHFTDTSAKSHTPTQADPQTSDAPPPALDGPSTETPSAKESPPSNEEVDVSEQFKTRFANESQYVETSQTNPQAKADELLEMAKKLKPEEVRYLALQSTNMQGPANSRILGVYILSLQPEIGLDGLLQVGLTPLTYGSEQIAHSPEESLAGQEKAVRRVALNSLIKLASQQNKIIPFLREKFKQIPDEELREFALRGIAKQI